MSARGAAPWIRISSDEAIEVIVRDGIDTIWQTMKDCVERGIATEGILPGGLRCDGGPIGWPSGCARRKRGEGERSAGAAGLGDGVCDGGERGERGGWPCGDRADEWRGGRGAGSGALLRALCAGGRSRRD